MAEAAMGQSTNREPFLAVVNDEATRRALLAVAEQNGWPPSQILIGGLSDAVEALSDIVTPQFLIVDLSDSADAMAGIVALAGVCEPDTRVITLGTVNDIELYRGLMDMGVDDYLVKPVSNGILNETIQRIIEQTIPETGDEAQGVGRLIAFVGVRGGVGATTLAANCAWQMANEQGLRVALVDLDLYFGTLALALDLEPGRGFREALENPSRIDGLFIERAMARQSENLYVLAAEEGLENSFSFDPAALDTLLATLRQDFDCVVFDIPRFAARTQTKNITPPATIVVVSDASLSGMRDTMRMEKFIREKSPQAEVVVALNGMGREKSGEISLADFESGAELIVDFQIPYDRKTATRGEGAGMTIAEVAAKSKVANAMRDLSRQASGRADLVAQGSFLSRLFKRKA